MSESISDTLSGKASKSSSATPRVPKPGGLLKSKRLKNKWTKDDVAKTLLLSMHHVEALENDEYDKLPGTTYVVGYWRSYANLLKIDISESIEFHKNNLGISPSVIALEAGHRRAHDHQEKARKRSVLVFFILSAMFLAGIWYWQNPDDNLLDQWLNDRAKTNVNNDDNQVISGELTPAILESGQYDFGALPKPNFSDDITNSVTETAVGEGDGVATKSVNNEDSQDTSSWQQEQEVKETQLAPTQSTEKVIEQVSKNVSEPAAETPVADSPNWIFLNVKKKSWLDVRVDGKQLIYRIVKAGESISLKGVPPFYVFVRTIDVGTVDGDPVEGVQVEYLGKPVRFKVNENSLVARFEVSQSGTKMYQ